MSDSSWQNPGHPSDPQYHKCEVCGLLTKGLEEVKIEGQPSTYRHADPHTCIRVAKGQPISDVIIQSGPDMRVSTDLTEEDRREIAEIAMQNALRRELHRAADEANAADQSAASDPANQHTILPLGPRDDGSSK